MDREMEGYISFFFFCFVGGISNQSPHPPAPLSCSLQLQIALPPLPPAVCPAKSAHDVSLSQLWVEIHRINRFVRETHAWDCLHAVRLVHLLVRPILPQATKKEKKRRSEQQAHRCIQDVPNHHIHIEKYAGPHARMQTIRCVV